VTAQAQPRPDARWVRPKFPADSVLQREIARRVDEYFERSGLSPRDSPQMYLKTAMLLTWFVGSYALLVFVVSSVWLAIPLSLSLALAVAGIGFGIQHDANHGAYSKRPAVNRLLGSTLDLLGASSYIWHWKHNHFHHTYPNMSGADADIELGPLGRLAPSQRRRGVHRFQQFYLWVLYGFLYVKWHLVDDIRDVTQGRVAQNRFPRPRGWRLAQLCAGKVAFFAWALVIPMILHTWWHVLLFYACSSIVVGVTLSVVFQMAHCIEEASFPVPVAGSQRVESGWVVHQLSTTADFARGNWLLTWYLGGLNFQVEHHLFPRVCHVHYPALSKVVEKACSDLGAPYVAHRGAFGALASHWRFLRRMGQPG